ncbi:hypothetical protein LTR84_012188 [Exophiala bonariae]|uniref:Uncharacterized protein n=1 Tax=Exophiala bonariae TaxID=1690606 RepID=A0AAV9NFV4_9EURO|nr:hypothetical protein LTR84_012188 [Exophiala bonariae]
MYLSSALVATSAFALHTAAFLIPLEVSNAVELGRPPFLNGPSEFELDCPGCPFFGVEDTAEVQYDIENKILLDFALDTTDGLTINGDALPTPFSKDPVLSFRLTAPQIRVQDGQKTSPLHLDFAWAERELSPSNRMPKHGHGFSMFQFELTITALNGHPVKVDTVLVHVLRLFNKKTKIVKISTIPFNDTPGATTCDTSSKWSICRIRAIIAARIQAMLNAAKTHTQAAKGWVKGQGKGCPGKFGHPGGHRGGPPFMHHEHGQASQGGHHYHHNHNAHRFGRLLHQVLRFFVIPALLGVIGGLMASAIGMLVGQFLVFLWIRFHRGGRRGNVRAVEIVIEDDEKDALIIDGEINPPQYEDVEASVDEGEKK